MIGFPCHSSRTRTWAQPRMIDWIGMNHGANQDIWSTQLIRWQVGEQPNTGKWGPSPRGPSPSLEWVPHPDGGQSSLIWSQVPGRATDLRKSLQRVTWCLGPLLGPLITQVWKSPQHLNLYSPCLTSYNFFLVGLVHSPPFVSIVLTMQTY